MILLRRVTHYNYGRPHSSLGPGLPIPACTGVSTLAVQVSLDSLRIVYRGGAGSGAVCATNTDWERA
jgi:hypothetical protein